MSGPLDRDPPHDGAATGASDDNFFADMELSIKQYEERHKPGGLHYQGGPWDIACRKLRSTMGDKYELGEGDRGGLHDHGDHHGDNHPDYHRNSYRDRRRDSYREHRRDFYQEHLRDSYRKYLESMAPPPGLTRNEDNGSPYNHHNGRHQDPFASSLPNMYFG